MPPVPIDAPVTVQQAAAPSPLDTAGQVAAERFMVELLDDPAVLAIQREVEAELRATPNAQGDGATDMLGEAILRWTGALILSEQANEPDAPVILWATDDAPHTWHGFTVPGRTAWGNDPNFIYRRTYFDGGGRYEITGQLDPARRPAQLTFEFKHGTPGDWQLNLANRGKSMDFGNQIAMLTDRDLRIAPDGSFRITIGGDGDGNAPVHVATMAGPVAVTIRDVLSDWKQAPPRLAIRRLDRPQGRPRDRAAVRAAVLAALPAYLRFWGHFPETFYARQEKGRLNGPVPRDGGWGYVASARFTLAPGEVVLVRTGPITASYVGAQFSDRWGLTPDPQKHFSSYNNAQMTPDADGGYSFVAAPDDPGTANWIDTAGARDGGVGLRWQGFDGAVDPAALVREFAILTRAELAARTDIARTTPEARKATLDRRARDYRTRIGQ